MSHDAEAWRTRQRVARLKSRNRPFLATGTVLRGGDRGEVTSVDGGRTWYRGGAKTDAPVNKEGEVTFETVHGYGTVAGLRSFRSEHADYPCHSTNGFRDDEGEPERVQVRDRLSKKLKKRFRKNRTALRLFGREGFGALA